MALNLSKCHYFALSFNISAVYIALGLLISLQPPFYPSEAEKMGATPAEYGFVFGIANLSLFLFSPLFGKYGPKIGTKLCFNFGAVLQGVSGFLFAFLPYLKTVGTFIGLSYLLRFLEGLGTAMAWSSALGILMKIFPNKVAKIMSWTQTCFGLGYMLGPGVGAALYSQGGFMLPFLVVGSLSTILSISLAFTIPNLNEEEPQPEEETTAGPQQQLRMREIVSSMSLFLPFLDLFAALCGNGMLESMLEPHLTKSGASAIDVGISFLAFGCCYMLGNLLFGGLIDKFGNPVVFSMFGNFLFLLSFLFIGPLPFMLLEPYKSLIQGMMALAGIAYSCMVVSSFSRAQVRVLQLGFADDINTYVMISGVWLSAFSLGNFVGPTIAGCLVQTQGFRMTTLVFFVLYALMILVDVCEYIHTVKRDRIRDQYENL